MREEMMKYIPRLHQHCQGSTQALSLNKSQETFFDCVADKKLKNSWSKMGWAHRKCTEMKFRVSL